MHLQLWNCGVERFKQVFYIFIFFLPFLQYYSKYAMRPFATSVAEELFQANIIPSDTDFRIFRDHGHVPGKYFRVYMYK